MDKWLIREGPAPQQKRKKTDEERTQSVKLSNKQYDEKKRRRTIVPSWKTEFLWLVTEDTGTANPPNVYCKTCRSVYSVLARIQVADKSRKYANGSYVTGSGYLRHDGLDHHQNCEGHRYAAQYLAVKAQKPGSSIAEKAIQSMNRAPRNVHAIAKKSRPISDFAWLCTLDQKKNVNIGQTYLNDKSGKEFMVSISEVTRGINFYKPQQKIHINVFVMKYSGLATLDQGWQLLKVVKPGV